ncbi:GlyGly-CTERM sorting domain-containing protein [Mucilaginibacter rubeus]|uniref:GlyGly-CTERM sorting domain-containing protein n=1 Tax=Mucilaginibacter rubeus TaxID=2027860 RepID=A0A5C1I975_9SPHI|nr:GlyGly-CTERM sorting domain-containing protein [Mucilaginibacter rubeus]
MKSSNENKNQSHYYPYTAANFSWLFLLPLLFCFWRRNKGRHNELLCEERLCF